MVKDSKHIVNLEQGATSTPEVQPIAFKATEEKEEPMLTKRLLIDASKLDNEEMTLIINSFRQILKQRKGKEYKPRSKRVCYQRGKFGHYIFKCPYASDSDRDDDKNGKKKMEKYYNKKKGGEAHMGKEWDSDESSTDSYFDEDVANIAINKGLLFPNIGHKCLMAKEGKKKKLYFRDTPKYTTFEDEGSSSEKNDYLYSLFRDTPKYTTFEDEGSSSEKNDYLYSLFANLNIKQKEKINESIKSINEKDENLEFQEDLLVKENKKFVKLKDAFALEVQKCKKLLKS
jgi:hypothetical protein